MNTSLRKLRATALIALPICAFLGCKSAEQAVVPDPNLAQAAAPPKVRTADELFSEAIAQFDAQKYDEAAKSFTALLEKQPTLVNARYNLGVIAERQGDLGRAEAAYQAAHKLDAGHVPTLLNLGKVYRLRDSFDKAIALYEEALKIPGKEYDVALLNNLTVAYRLAKQFGKAEATVRKVLSRTKDNPDAYKNLALIYYDQGNFRLAEFISANAKKLDDKDPGVYNNLGMVYIKMEERRLALGQFQKAVSLNDKFAPGHMNIGAMALSYRDYETAEKACAKVVGLDPTSYEGHLAYALALDGQKGRDPKKGLSAGAAFEKVLAIIPAHADATCGAGWAYAAEKSGWDKAVSFLEKCKAQASTTPQDQQLIDAKLKGILAMQKSGAAQPATAQKETPKTTTGGGSLLDKVSDQAAKEEGVPPEGAPPGAAPAGGAPPAGQTPAPAPAPAPAGKAPAPAAAPAPAPAETK